MGPNISKPGGGQKQKQNDFQPNQSTNGPGLYNDSSGFIPGSHDGSMANSFIRGHSPDNLIYHGQANPQFKGAGDPLKGRQDQQPSWIQLSRQQQRIYCQWRKAHKSQLRFKELKREQQEQVQLAQQQNNTDNVNGPSSTGDAIKREEEAAPTSIWEGLQKRLAFTRLTNITGQKEEDSLDEQMDVALTIQINDTETMRVPLDLTEHETLQSFTSQWLQDQIFKVVRDKRLAARSASHSKSSTDVPGSEDGQSSFNKQQQLLHQQQILLAQLEPVCLSTVYNEAECVDFLLTQKNQMVATFLPMEIILKVNYVAKDELDEERNNKLMPSLRNFDFIKVLGTGGFATVYMVRKRTTGQLYAMKLVKKDGVKQDQVKFAQVYTERQILEQLKNPFLVQLHYAFVTTNYFCLVIDLCTGGELFYYLQKNSSFQLANAKLLFAEVVLAVEFLHSHNILYRDLKPENILVDERGHLRLTDFGLCRGNFKQNRDRAMSFVGSPEYMSPEILLGQGYDYSVDFYTMGVLLYEMLVGLPPHYNEDKMQMYKDITMKEPSIPSVLPADARDILEHLLQIEPADRLGMGPTGIQEIKNHTFFKDIDWQLLSLKAPQPGRKRLPLEVNILDSNFDKQYTRLPIKIDAVQEELIKINEPIVLTKQTRVRSKSYTWKPQPRASKTQCRNSQHQQQQLMFKKKSHQRFGGRAKGLNRETTILSGPNHQRGSMMIEESTQQSKSGNGSSFNHLRRHGSKQNSMPPTKRRGRGLYQANSIDPNSMEYQNQDASGCNRHHVFSGSMLDQERTLQRQSNSNKLNASDAVFNPQHLVTHKQLPAKPQSLQKSIQEPFNGNGISTVEIGSSVQTSQADFKNCSSMLDVFAEREPNSGSKTAKNGAKASQFYQDSLQIDEPMTNTHQHNQHQMVVLPPYHEALSPITPLQAQKNGFTAAVKHGFSEYNKRGSTANIGKSNQQENAFAYRKQTLNDEDEVTAQDLKSCTEVDYMQLRGENQLTTSRYDIEGTVSQIQNASSTTQKGATIQVRKFTTPSGIASEKAKVCEKTPKNFMAETNVLSYMGKLSPYMLTMNQKPFEKDSTQRKILERVADEVVLQEDYHLTAGKVLPAQTNHQRNQPYFGQREMNLQDLMTPTEATRQVGDTVESPTFLNDCKKQESLMESNEYGIQTEVKIVISPSNSEPHLQESDQQYPMEFNAYADMQSLNVDDNGAHLDPPKNRETFASYYDSDEYSQKLEQVIETNQDNQLQTVIKVGELSSSTNSLEIDTIEDERNESALSYIQQSKIQVMQKMKTKKLKKRLSMNNRDQLLISTTTKAMQEGQTQERDFNFQYGFSVEQQRERQSQGVSVIKFNQSGIMRNVAKHQSSQNISNLIAQSVRGMTPKIFSKNASREKLPDMPESVVPAFESSGMPSKQLSSLQHSKLIHYTEKAAGVVSERNRKFSKPQTLKNLEQKMLQADDDNELNMMVTEDDILMDSAQQQQNEQQPHTVEMFKLDLPADTQTADDQLNYNSEIISINEFESRVEDYVPETDKIRVEEQQDESHNDNVNVSSEDDAIDASPVLQFQSQSMADISSPQYRRESSARRQTQPLGIIRESISSPIIGKKHHTQMQLKEDSYLGVSRNQISDMVQPTHPSQSGQASKRKITLDKVLMRAKKSGSISPTQFKSKKANGEPLFMPSSTKSLAHSKFTGNGSSHTKMGRNNKASPGRLGKTKTSLRDFFPHIQKMVVDSSNTGKSTSNMSLHLQEFHTSSKKLSMVVPPSPYNQSTTGQKKKKTTSKANKDTDSYSIMQMHNLPSRGTSSRASYNTKASKNNNQNEKQSSSQSTYQTTGCCKHNNNGLKKKGGAKTSQKTKQAGNKSMLSATGNLPSTHKNNLKSVLNSSGKASIMHMSGKPKNQQAPPRQPVLLTSPIQKIQTGDQSQLLSLRVLQTPDGMKQHQTDSAQTSKQAPFSPHDSSQNLKEARHSSNLWVPQKSSSAKRLATVSSHRSLTSKGQKTQQSALTQTPRYSCHKKDHHPQQQNPFNSHFAIHEISNFPTFQPSQTLQIEKETYKNWRDGSLFSPNPEVVKNLAEKTTDDQIICLDNFKLLPSLMNQKSQSRSSINLSATMPLPRSNSQANYKRAMTLPQQCCQEMRGKQKTSRHTQNRQSIFEVVDDIMSSLALASPDAPYGASKSPQINQRKQKQLELLESNTFLKDAKRKNSQKRCPLSASDRAHSRKNLKKQRHSSTKYDELTSPQYTSARAIHQTTSPQCYDNEQMPFILEQDYRFSNPDFKKDYNMQLVPIEPGDSSQQLATFNEDEDDCSEKRGGYLNDGQDYVGNHQHNNSSLGMSVPMQLHVSQNSTLGLPTDGNLMNQGPTPRALELNKQSTPFKGKFFYQAGLLNETSVEVLKLDASEFNISDQELTKSNLITLRSEEFLGEHSQQQRALLNSTFQYVAGQDKVQSTNDLNGGVLSADGVHIIISDGREEIDQQRYPEVSLPETDSAKGSILIFDKPSDQLAENPRRGSALVPKKKGNLLSANSINSLGKTDRHILDNRQVLSSGNDSQQKTSTTKPLNKMPIAKVPHQNSEKSPTQSFVSMKGYHVHLNTTSNQSANRTSKNKKGTNLGSFCSPKSSNALKSQYYKKQSKKGKKQAQQTGKTSQVQNQKMQKNKSAVNTSQPSDVPQSQTQQSLPAKVQAHMTYNMSSQQRSMTQVSGKISAGGLSSKSAGRRNHNIFSNCSQRKPQSPQTVSHATATAMIFPKKVSLDLGSSVEKPRGSTTSLKMLLHSSSNRNSNNLMPMQWRPWDGGAADQQQASGRNFSAKYSSAKGQTFNLGPQTLAAEPQQRLSKFSDLETMKAKNNSRPFSLSDV